MKHIILATQKRLKRAEKAANISMHDDVLAGITYGDLIDTVASNNPVANINKQTVTKEYRNLVRMKQRDAEHELNKNMNFIIKEAAS